MRCWDGLALALLTLLSNVAPLAVAQYVTTVTVSINDNPFCTPVSRIGAFGGSAGDVGGVGSASGSGAAGTNDGGANGSQGGSGSGDANGPASVSSPATNGGVPIVPINTTTGSFDALGYYAAPADGRLLNGPMFSSPLMSVELCGTSCQGYTYLALTNGNECNCGTSVPSGTSSSSPPAQGIRRAIGGGCTPCAGNSAECCGAPGGFALLYRFTPYVEGSSVVVYSSTNAVGSVVEALSTYSPNSSPSVIAHTSTGSDGSVTIGFITSYGGGASASTSIYSAIHSASSASYSNYNSPNVVKTSTTSIPGGGKPQITGKTSTTSTVGTMTAFSGGNSVATGAAANGGHGGATTTATGGNNAASGAAGSGATGGDDGAGAGTATTSGGPTPVNGGGGGVEPTVNSPKPSCVKSSGYVGNNTKYTDYFGYTYDIRCNLDLQSTPTDHDAYADTFEDCLEYCSLLTGCIAVSFQDPPTIPNKLSNCAPKWSFGGYKTSVTDGVYSGVNVNGASPGTLESQNLCTKDNEQGTSYDGITYYDDYGTAWTIGCNHTLAISNAASLSSTVTDTLASCVDYCSDYIICDMVNWTGPHTNGTLDDPNCFPASSNGTAGAAGSASGSGYATLNL